MHSAWNYSNQRISLQKFTIVSLISAAFSGVLPVRTEICKLLQRDALTRSAASESTIEVSWRETVKLVKLLRIDLRLTNLLGIKVALW